MGEINEHGSLVAGRYGCLIHRIARWTEMRFLCAPYRPVRGIYPLPKFRICLLGVSACPPPGAPVCQECGCQWSAPSTALDAGDCITGCAACHRSTTGYATIGTPTRAALRVGRGPRGGSRTTVDIAGRIIGSAPVLACGLSHRYLRERPITTIEDEPRTGGAGCRPPCQGLPYTAEPHENRSFIAAGNGAPLVRF